MRKILLLIMFVFTIITNGEEKINDIAKDYPYKGNPIMATVLGTPKSQKYQLKKIKSPTIKKFKSSKEIPEILRQWSTYDYGIWKQESEAPLIVLISGTGSLYNGELSKYLANVFYDNGYNVISFSSTSTMPYIVSQSKNNYAGYIKDEIPELYNLINKAIEIEVSEGMKITEKYVGGYSLGGYQSLLLQEYDTQKKSIGFKKSLLLNTPVNILTATEKLDNYLIKNGVYDIRSLEKYFNNIFVRLIEKNVLKNISTGTDSITDIFANLGVKNDDLELMTGLLFRFYSANMTFAGEVFSGENSKNILSDKDIFKRFDSITKEFQNGMAISFNEYAFNILYPYLKENKHPDLTKEQFINAFSLKNSQNFIDENNKDIIFITSKDDVLTSEEEIKYIKETFKNKEILPYGGHTGILWHKDVIELILEKMKEN